MKTAQVLWIGLTWLVSTRNLVPYDFRKLMCFYFIIYTSPISGDSIIKPVGILKKTNIAILNVSCLYTFMFNIMFLTTK